MEHSDESLLRSWAFLRLESSEKEKKIHQWALEIGLVEKGERFRVKLNLPTSFMSWMLKGFHLLSSNFMCLAMKEECT